MRWIGLICLALAVGFVVGGPGRGDTQSKSLKELLADLKNSDPTVRIMALQGMAALGPETQKEAGRPVIAQLKAKDVNVKIAACAALGIIGLDPKDQPEGLRDLQGMLTDTQIGVRMQAALTLARFGPLAKNALPKLADLAKSQDSWELRKAAVYALGAIGQDPQLGPTAQVLRSCADRLKDDCTQVQLEALSSLISLGPPAPQLAGDRGYVLQKLTPLLKDSDKMVAIWSRIAYMRMDKPDDRLTKEIANHLNDSQPEIRGQALRALGTFGPEAKGYLKEFIKALSDAEPMVIVCAAGSLAGMGAAAKDSLADLKKLKDHKEEFVRKAAEEAVKQIEADKK